MKIKLLDNYKEFEPKIAQLIVDLPYIIGVQSYQNYNFLLE